MSVAHSLHTFRASWEGEWVHSWSEPAERLLVFAFEHQSTATCCQCLSPTPTCSLETAVSGQKPYLRCIHRQSDQPNSDACVCVCVCVWDAEPVWDHLWSAYILGSIHLFGQDWNNTATTWWISMKFQTKTSGSQMVNPNDFGGDPLTLCLAPLWDWHFCFWNVLTTIG